MKLYSITVQTGKNFNLLEVIKEKEEITSDTVYFKKVGFAIHNLEYANRKILLNNNLIYLLPDQTLEIEDIEINQLSTIDNEILITITYII